jgi:hypothetical protein
LLKKLRIPQEKKDLTFVTKFRAELEEHIRRQKPDAVGPALAVVN